MSIFENMGPREIAVCLSAFYEDAQEWKGPRVSLMSTQVRLPNRDQPINMFRSDYNEGIKILRDDYDVFWTPDTKPDDLKWKISKRRMKEMKELDERIAANSWYGASTGVAFGPGCVVTGNDYLYRKELGLPDNATVADILERIRDIRKANENQAKHASKLVQPITDVAKERDEADRLRRHWHSKYKEEHEECVRLSKLHAADKEKKNKQDTVIHNLRDNLVDSIEECKKLNGRIHDLEALVVNLTHDDEKDE